MKYEILLLVTLPNKASVILRIQFNSILFAEYNSLIQCKIKKYVFYMTQEKQSLSSLGRKLFLQGYVKKEKQSRHSTKLKKEYCI